MKTPSARGRSRLREFVQSIRFRLTLWTVAILAVILLVFCVFVYTRTAYDLEVQGYTQLQVQAQQLAMLFRAPPHSEQEEQTAPTGLQANTSISLSEHQNLAIVASSGEVVQRVGSLDDATIGQVVKSGGPPGQAFQRVPCTASGTGAAGGEKGKQIYQVSPIVWERRWVGLLILGMPLDAAGQLPRLALSLALGSLATLGIALGSGYCLAGRAMAPVRTITRTARGISETDLHQRLKLGTHDELGELADTFDAMLDRLQAAFDRQRQFTADASHELRTPLTIVSLEADQALARRRSTEEYERAMKVIKSENEFMARLVNDLLTLARMDAGQTQLKLEPLDLSDIGLEVTERLSALANRAGVEIELGELPAAPVNGDRQYLSQMVTNLVENAIKYAGGRGKHVRIETGTRAQPGGAQAWLSVEDDGPGIPPDHLPHLFGRFYRVDPARARRQEETAEGEPDKEPEGSGLGLSIVQWIARAHQGEVSVDSQVGRGSRFEVRLPLAT